MHFVHRSFPYIVKSFANATDKFIERVGLVIRPPPFDAFGV